MYGSFILQLLRLIIALLMPYIIKCDSQKREYHVNLKIVKIFCYCIALYVVLVGKISTFDNA